MIIPLSECTLPGWQESGDGWLDGSSKFEKRIRWPPLEVICPQFPELLLLTMVYLLCNINSESWSNPVNVHRKQLGHCSISATEKRQKQTLHPETNEDEVCSNIDLEDVGRNCAKFGTETHKMPESWHCTVAKSPRVPSLFQTSYCNSLGFKGLQLFNIPHEPEGPTRSVFRCFYTKTGSLSLIVPDEPTARLET